MKPFVKENIVREATLTTDEAAHSAKAGQGLKAHEIVRHNAGEDGDGEFPHQYNEGLFQHL